jgi:amino acid transporter
MAAEPAVGARPADLVPWREPRLIGSRWPFTALFGAAALAGAAAISGWLVAGVTVLILALVHAAFIGAAPPPLLTRGFAGVPAVSPISIDRFAGLAGLGWLAFPLRADAFISPSGAGLICQASTLRVDRRPARGRCYPPIFAAADTIRVPWISPISAFLFRPGIPAPVPQASVPRLAGPVVGASVLTYAGAPPSMGALRRTVPQTARAHRARAAAVHSPAAFLAANLAGTCL